MATGSLTRRQNQWSLITTYWGDLATGECQAQLIGDREDRHARRHTPP
jgi:hypothetical protein